MGRVALKPAIDDRLLDTAIEQFGRLGLEGVSTRALAAAANTAMSSITYHYGGKEGLYLAAARHIAGQIAGRFAAALEHAPEPESLDSAAAVEQVTLLAEAMLGMMLSAEAASWARFVVREQMEPTEAFNILWTQIMGPVSGRLVKLVLRAGNGRWKAAEARVRAAAVIGQVLIFRVARATVLRVTGWQDIGPLQTGEIRRVLRAHIRAMLNASEANQ
jgi:AcrR family transcriptional regulator